MNGNVFRRDFKYQDSFPYLPLNTITVDEENIYYETYMNHLLIDKRSDELVVPTIHSKLPSHVTKIGAYAFYGCTYYGFTIPSHIKKIGDFAFAGSESLSEVIINANITVIPKGCFYNDIKLFKVSLSSTVNEIENYAFYNCSLSDITLPDELKVISDYAFCNGTLWRLKLPSKLEVIGAYAFSNNLLNKIIIPRSVIIVGKSAFAPTEAQEGVVEIFAEAIELPLFWDPLFNIGNYPLYWYSSVENTDGHHWHYVGDSPWVW
jgi:hypothetical protein